MWQAHVTVATVVHREGKFLMVKERANGKEVYNQPAGHLDPGESMVQAAIRETLEETGWLVDPTGLLGVYQWQKDADTSFVRFAFVARCVKHQSQKIDADIIEALWLSMDEIKQRRENLRSPLVMACIEQYAIGRVYPLHLLQQL